jgi:hypothetical protein
MNNQLGSDEDRKCNKESDVHFNIAKKESRPRFPAEELRVARSNSGSHANKVIMSSRR